MNTHRFALAPYLFVDHDLKRTSGRIETYIHEFARFFSQFEHGCRMIDYP